MAKAVFYGDLSRFCIRKVEGGYAVFDAEGVSDAELKAGKASPEIFRCTMLAHAKARCNDIQSEEYFR